MCGLRLLYKIFRKISGHSLDFWHVKYYFKCDCSLHFLSLTQQFKLDPENAKPIVRWGRKATGLSKIAGLPGEVKAG